MRLIDGDKLLKSRRTHYYEDGESRFDYIPVDSVHTAETIIAEPSWIGVKKAIPAVEGKYVCLCASSDGETSIEVLHYFKDNDKVKNGFYEYISDVDGFTCPEKTIKYWMEIPDVPRDNKATWHPCTYVDGKLKHDGTWKDGRWYEWMDKNDNREKARMKDDAFDHFWPEADILEEDIIAFREIEGVNYG